MINTLNKLQQLRQQKYQFREDKQVLLELYQDIYTFVEDKDNFEQNSSGILRAIEDGSLTEQEEKKWLDYATLIFASFMAVKIYEKTLNGTLQLSSDEIEQVLFFYTNSNFNQEIASVGIYACAQQLCQDHPMRCYELTKVAFKINPDLANVLGISYRYEEKTGEDNITEKCPFCNSEGDKLVPYYCSPQILKLNNNYIFPPAKLWMKCECCDNYFVYDFPKTRVGLINGHYTQDRNDILQNKFNLSYYNPIFQQFQAMTSGKNYLEVGVGTGEMLAVALEYGYHVKAVEICREDCERISHVLNIDVNWCDITDYETEGKFDIIAMGDVFEHVTHPVRILEKARDMLERNGVLWISTPNYNSAYARMQKFSHAMWHEKNHYTYVSFESLNKLLKDLGMKVVHYSISMRYIGSMELYIKHCE